MINLHLNYLHSSNSTVRQHLLYVERSISSGSSPTFTSNRSWTSFRIFASFSSETNVIARPLVPNRPALATWHKRKKSKVNNIHCNYHNYFKALQTPMYFNVEQEYGSLCLHDTTIQRVHSKRQHSYDWHMQKIIDYLPCEGRCQNPQACHNWRQYSLSLCPFHGQTGWWQQASSLRNLWTVCSVTTCQRHNINFKNDNTSK